MVQATAAKMGAPFRDMMTTAGQRLQDYLENYKSSKAKANDKSTPDPDKVAEESKWERLEKVFAEVDKRQSRVDDLKVRLVRCNIHVVSLGFMKTKLTFSARRQRLCLNDHEHSFEFATISCL